MRDGLREKRAAIPGVPEAERERGKRDLEADDRSGSAGGRGGEDDGVERPRDVAVQGLVAPAGGRRRARGEMLRQPRAHGTGRLRPADLEGAGPRIPAEGVQHEVARPAHGLVGGARQVARREKRPRGLAESGDERIEAVEADLVRGAPGELVRGEHRVIAQHLLGRCALFPRGREGLPGEHGREGDAREEEQRHRAGPDPVARVAVRHASSIADGGKKGNGGPSVLTGR